MGPTEPVILKKINCVNFVTRPPRSPFGAARGSTCGNYWGGGGRGQTVVMLWKEILLAVSMTLVGSTGYTPSSSALTRSKAAKAWKQSGGILVCKSFLSAEEHRHVMEDANSLSSCLQPETNSIATGRQAAKISSSMLIHEIFSSPAVASKLSSIVGEELTAATDFPMELRVYRVGASMPWHSDDVIYFYHPPGGGHLHRQQR